MDQKIVLRDRFQLRFLGLFYFKQKRDRISEAATVVLLEIRQAEKTISTLQESRFVNTIDGQLLIVTNRWQDYAHLFARKLDHDELDLISRFYSNCQAIDRFIGQISSEEQVRAKTVAFQKTLCSLALENKNNPDNYKNDRDAFVERINSEDLTLTPKAPRDLISRRLNAIESVTTTSAGMKLKHLASRRW